MLPPHGKLSLPAEWQASQQQPAALPTKVSTNRKRCRQDVEQDDIAVPLLSAGLSSARDPQAPNVNVVVRAPAEVAPLPPAAVATNSADDSSEALSSVLAKHRHSGALAARYGSNLGAVLVAAKQAAAVLKQHACSQLQQRAKEAAQNAQQTHRCLILTAVLYTLAVTL